jgi:hypothetical protein
MFNILSSAAEARLPCLPRGGWCELGREEWAICVRLHG